MKSVTRRTRWASSAAFGAALAVALGSAAARADDTPPRWMRPGLALNAVIGAQGLLTQSLGSASSQLTTGGGAGFWVQANGLKAPWNDGQTLRLTLWGTLGMGEAGFEGAIGSEGAYGLRWSEPLVQPRPEDPFATPLDDGGDPRTDTVWHALVARLGYAARMSHNDRVEGSLVEIPRLELGYQILGSFALEVRAHAGVVLTGELGAEEGRRKLPTSMGWGGTASLMGRLGVIEVGLERIQPFEDDGLGPVDVADGRICVQTSRRPGMTFGICGNGRVERMIIPRAGDTPTESATVYGGLLLGLGVH
jgi:hypothetical protein